MSTTEPTPAPAPDQAAPPATPVAEAPTLAEAVPGRVLSGRPDKLDLQSGGKIDAVIAGERYVLRAPSLPEMRPFKERLDALQNEQLAKMKADPPEAWDPVDDVVDWVKDVVTALADHPYQVPDDETPVWITNAGLPGRVIAHWRAIPEG